MASIYFISHHSNIGIKRKYNIRKIPAIINISITYFLSRKCNISCKTSS
ncbi:MAG: hypothetical protein LBU14_03605 [Candidatus Peribacteria bacterium]|nr:hypothetical protein [Candidatus Peribacteria bacterium]